MPSKLASAPIVKVSKLNATVCRNNSGSLKDVLSTSIFFNATEEYTLNDWLASVSEEPNAITDASARLTSLSAKLI